MCLFSNLQVETKAMPNFEAVAKHAKLYMEDDRASIHQIEETDGCCTCRYQSCCYVS